MSTPSSVPDSSFSTLLSHPLAFVDAALERAAATAGSHASLAESDWCISETVQELIGLKHIRSSSENRLGSIPSLNGMEDVTLLRPNQLVRFRGMVQETFQPEYFMGLWTPPTSSGSSSNEKQQRPRTGKFRDAFEQSDLDFDMNSGESTTLERMSLNVIPIPGESPWVASAAHQLEQQSGHTYNHPATSSNSTNTPATKKKRSLAPELTTDTDASMDTSETAAAAASSSDDVSMAPDSKKVRHDDASNTALTAAVDATGKVVGTEDHGMEVIVTVYDGLATKENPKVTHCYEFIGILSIQPDLIAEMETDGFEIGNEGWNPRRRKAIRMHALCAIPIESGFPFIPDPKLDAPLFTNQLNDMKSIVDGVRTSLVTYLTDLFIGDSLAGEVVLLFLLQRLHTRTNGGGGVAGSSIGKLSINLIAPPLPNDLGCESQLSQKIHQVFEMLMPRTKKFDLTIESLNQQVWQPVKNYESDSLDRNLLQLSSPSTVLFDETRLNPGQLTNIGVSNLQVLHKVLATSQLEYDFKYQSLGFDIDWSIMFISSNVKTLLQQDGAGQHGIDLTLRLAPKSTKQLYGLKTDEQQQQQPTSQQLDYWRAYLLLARQSTFQIAPTMSKSIEDHFVSLRKLRPSTTSESTLHLLLNLARLHSLSHLEHELATQERWNQVTNMFEQIQQRNTV